jgi:Zn-dependent protease
MSRSPTGLTIAKIGGVRLKVHFSLLFLLIYIIVIAGGQFPLIVTQSGINPELLYSNSIFWGLSFALGLFVSVILHEFGHVWVAQSMGVKVSGVTLMMLGGVSEMEKIPDKPFAEFKVSIVGPLVSFAIAGGLLILSKVAPIPNIQFYSYWLSRANFVLGVFNLLPAFPLDGGRVFRSLLAARQGTAQATATTVSLAKGLAWTLGVLGFFQFNMILMLIAVFIYSAASSELMLSESRGLLSGITVGDVGIRMSSLPEDASLKQAASLMFQIRSRALPVNTTAGPPMLVTLKQLRGVPRDAWNEVSLKDLMTPSVRVLESSTPLDEVLPELASAEVLPFVENGKIAGVVRYQDLTDLVEFRGLDESLSEGHKKVG